MEDVTEVNLYDYVQVVWKRRVLIALVFAASVLCSVALSWGLLPPVYEAKALLMVNTEAPSGLPEWSMGAYVEAAKSGAVRASTLRRLGPDTKVGAQEFDAATKVKAVGDASVLELSVRRRSAEEAARMANDWADAFRDGVEAMKGLEASGSVTVQRGVVDALTGLLSQVPPVLPVERSIVDDPLLAQALADLTRGAARGIAGLRVKVEEVNPVYQELARRVAAAQADLKLLEAWQAAASERRSGWVRVVSPAFAPDRPVAPRKAQNVVVGGVVGLLVGLAAAFTCERLPRTAIGSAPGGPR